MGNPKNPVPMAMPRRRGSDYSPVEWLDLILKALVTETSDGKFHMDEAGTLQSLYGSIYDKDEKVSFENVEFKGALDKLLDDKFIKANPPYIGNTEISISFLGLLHVQKGGYKALFEDEERQKTKGVMNYWFVVAVGVASLFACCYYLTETVRIFFPCWFPKSY